MTRPVSEPATTGEGLRWTVFAMLMVSGFLSAFVLVGADCFWLVALGDDIRERGSVPSGIPFATAPSGDWPNILVAAELTLSLLNELGQAALPVFQVAVVITALMVIGWSARSSGAADGPTATVMTLVALGSLPALAIVRLQVFSLVPFALLLWLLHSQHRRPTKLIWCLPALVAVWTNFHGAVLLGVSVAGAYLLFSRLRERTSETLLVGPASLVALVVTPERLRTVDYYRGVMDNEAAAQASGLWARPSLSAPFDVVMFFAAAVLLVLVLRRRLPVWEYVIILGLGGATVMASRNGVWLLMALAVPAALSMTRHSSRAAPAPPRFAGAAALAVLVPLVLVPFRGSAVLPDEPAEVRALAEKTRDRVVLAPEPLAESLALVGVRLWVLDPIDAFGAEDQRTYLAFLDDGDVEEALPHVEAVIVAEGSDQARSMEIVQDFTLDSTHGEWLVYLRG